MELYWTKEDAMRLFLERKTAQTKDFHHQKLVQIGVIRKESFVLDTRYSTQSPSGATVHGGTFSRCHEYLEIDFSSPEKRWVVMSAEMGVSTSYVVMSPIRVFITSRTASADCCYYNCAVVPIRKETYENAIAEIEGGWTGSEEAQERLAAFLRRVKRV